MAYKATYRTRTYLRKGKVARTNPVPGLHRERNLLVDGNWNFIGERARMVVRGDCESVSIAAASIVVKVARDALMTTLSACYPHYAFESNKGYPAPQHLWGLAAYGPSPIHRRLYAPIRKLLEEGVPGRLLPAGARGADAGGEACRLGR